MGRGEGVVEFGVRIECVDARVLWIGARFDSVCARFGVTVA